MSGIALELGPPRQRLILAILLAFAGETVPMHSIVNAIWGTEPPDRAVNVVHKHIGALRRMIEPGLPRRGQGSWLVSEVGGYRARVDPDSLDLLRFRDRLRRAALTVDADVALDLTLEALEIWRGPAAADLRDAAWTAEPLFLALDHEFVAAAITAAERARSVGRWSEVLPALELAAQLNPTDERLHGALIRCLAAAGRRQEALTAYHVLYRSLRDDFGVDPGPELRAAHVEVLNDRVRADAPSPPVRALPTPSQLPADLTVFVGRATELAALLALADTTPESPSLAVVTGTAGVGKTSVAVHFANQVADRFPDGQLYVDLRGFSPDRPQDSFDVLGRFLEAMDVPPAKIPHTMEARSALWRSASATRRMIVILDNARDTAQVIQLLPGGVSSATVITSRSQLRGLSGVADLVLPLDLFSAPESAEFLARRLGAARVDESASSTLHAAAAGLPLSLTLLAARAAHAPHLDLADLVTYPEDGDALLVPFLDRSDPRTDARTVLSWSYHAVSDAAARLFRAVSLYPGVSIATSTAAALVDLDQDTTQVLLDELVEANLLALTRRGRFAAHDLLRAYASELLAEDDEEARAAERRLFQHCTRRAEIAARAVSTTRIGHDPADAPPRDDRTEVPRNPDGTDFAGEAAVSWLVEEHHALVALTLRTAERDGMEPFVWQLAWALEQVLDRRGLWSDNRAVQCAAVRTAQRCGRPVAEAISSMALARVMANLGDLEGAARLMARVLELVEPVQEQRPLLASEANRYLVWILEQQGDSRGGLEHAKAALALVRPDAPPGSRARAMTWLARAETLTGNPDSALDHCSRALDVLEASNLPFHRAIAWSTLAITVRALGRYDEAVRAHQRALDLYRSLEALLQEARELDELGQTLLDADRLIEARSASIIADGLLSDLGHVRAQVVRDRITVIDTRLRSMDPADSR